MAKQCAGGLNAQRLVLVGCRLGAQIPKLKIIFFNACRLTRSVHAAAQH